MAVKAYIWLAEAILLLIACVTAKRPNIVFIISDDQDVRLGSLNYMQHVQSDIIGAGLDVKNHFGTVALCCPARATLFRGQAAHNTNITHVCTYALIVFVLYATRPLIRTLRRLAVRAADIPSSYGLEK